MVIRKTQYGWMATGSLVCLFAMILACKLRDGTRAAAQGEPAPAAKAAEPKAEAPKKEAPPLLEGLTPLETPGNPLPPLDVKPDVPVSPAAPPPVLPSRKEGTDLPPLLGPDKGPPSTMPLPPPAGPAGVLKDGPLPPPAPVTPARYSPDPTPVTDGGTILPPDRPGAGPERAPLAGSASPLVPPVGPPAKPSEPTWDKPATPPPPVEPAETRPLPGEPPLAPSPGPVQHYQVRTPETMRDLARRTLGTAERWTDIHKLNPMLKPEATLAAGTALRLPGDACVTAEEPEPVKPLPAMHPKAGPTRPKVVLPLTGTYPANLDDKKTMTLPAAMREQLAGVETVLVSPGPDKCLWLTNQAHLERLAQRLEHSPAREADVRVFKRLYFAQTEKAALSPEGRVSISERLAQFAGLHQEVVLVGIDDHFELWDAARWRQYTQQKSAAAHPGAEHE
jgi:MraZ protein